MELPLAFFCCANAPFTDGSAEARIRTPYDMVSTSTPLTSSQFEVPEAQIVTVAKSPLA
jgi:hypothetical protein